MKVTNRIRKYIVIAILTYTILLLFLTVARIQFSFYYFTVVAIVLFILYMEQSYRKEMKQKEKELESLDWLLSELRHRYYVHGMVDEAMRESMEICKNAKLKRKIHDMLEVLTSLDTKTAFDRFCQMNDNRYYGMLLTLSLMVMEFGDKTVEKQSLFLSNLKTLRCELHMEMQNSKTIRHYFVGLTFVILLPVMSLKFIEAWGVSNLNELASYYEGTYQIIFYLFLFLLTIGLYYLFYLFKSPIKMITNQHHYLKLITKKKYLQRFFVNYVNWFGKSAHKQEVLLMEVGETMDLTMLLVRRSLVFVLAFLCFNLIGVWLYGIERIAVIGLCGYAFAYFCAKLPVFLLHYRRHMMQMYMEEEVFQYQSILMMLMYMDRISTFELLEVMEGFAVIFKKPLKACLTEFESGQIKALVHLKEKVRCQAMEKLIDNLMMCDEIGVEKALDELTLEMTFYNEQRKQQMEYNLEKKGILCKFLAFVPLIITIGLYLIFPFISVSISKLMDISNEITGVK